MAQLALARPRVTPLGLLGWAALGLLVAVAVIFRPPYLGGTTNYLFVYGESMEPTMHTGDLAVFVVPDAYRIGDIVAYHPSQAPDAVIIHRIVGGNAIDGFRVEGDRRTTSDLDMPKPEQLIGKALFWVPNAGWFLNGFRLPLIFGGIVALVIVFMVWDRVPGFRRPRS